MRNRILDISVPGHLGTRYWTVQDLDETIFGTDQGRIQDFKLGEGVLKKIAPSGGRREICWDISCEKSRLYAKKSYFFQY